MKPINVTSVEIEIDGKKVIEKFCSNYITTEVEVRKYIENFYPNFDMDKVNIKIIETKKYSEKEAFDKNGNFREDL